MDHNIVLEQDSDLNSLSSTSENDSWSKRILRNFEAAFLFQIVIQMFNDGLLVMKMLAMKELFKTNYGLEPSQV
jgi:hypothetical protein